MPDLTIRQTYYRVSLPDGSSLWHAARACGLGMRRSCAACFMIPGGGGGEARGERTTGEAGFLELNAMQSLLLDASKVGGDAADSEDTPRRY